MRIAYVYGGADLSRNAGVTGKIIDQVQAWSRSAHEVQLFLQTYSAGGLSEHLVREAGVTANLFMDAPVRGAGALGAAYRRLGTIGALSRAVRDWQPTLVYFRFSVSYPALARLAREIPTVLEINTDDLQEWRRHLPTYKYLYHRITRSQLLRRAAGVVFATGELASPARFSPLADMRVVIANGVALHRYGTGSPKGDGRRRIAFIGEPGFAWHGVDKLLELARACPDWDFDVIGYGPQDLMTTAPPNVRCHGYLGAERYGGIVANADAAVGTLALHRKGMEEACPLKVREYLARGIPTVIGYRDTDFPRGGWFLLQLPNAEDNISANVGTIRGFVERMRGRRVSREEIGHLDVEVKEQQRLAFFQRVVEARALRWPGPR